MNDRNLYFLLKDKYGWTQTQISEYLTRACDSNSCQTMYLTDEEKADIELLNKGVPVDYLIGYVEFLGYHIDLSYKPLIPRTETEYWVDLAIRKIKNELKSNSKNRTGYNYKKDIKILDMFSGSGCIGIAVYKRLYEENIKNLKIIFSDIDKNAINQIRKNAKINKISKKDYKIIKSNLFENINEKFDYIFANPPYVSKNDEIDKSIKYEPEIALFANENGLSVIKNFIKKVPNYLKTNGFVFMEFGLNQEKEIENLLKNVNITEFEFVKDQFGKNRLVIFRNS